MVEPLLDTSIFIDLFKRTPDAREYIGTRLRSGRLALHATVAAELLSGVRTRSELAEFDELTAQTRRLVPNEADWTLGLRLCREYRRSVGVDWVDCLVAATAIRLKVPIVTTNDKHFRPIREIDVVRPY